MLLNYYQPKHHIKSCRHLADRLGVLVFASSLVVLLLGFITTLNPQWLYGDIAHAVEDTSTANNAKNANSDARNNTTGNTTVGNTTASLTLNTSDIHKDAAPGTVAYASKNITVRAVNITNYSLTITAPVGLSGNTEFTNTADGSNAPITLADMPSNSWGYSYVKEGLTTSSNVNGSDEVDDLSILEALNYTFFTGKPQTLESGNTPTTNTRTLVFAAKFGSNAVNGNYKAEVTVSLATTPSKLVFDNITTMQAMTPDICTRADKYDSALLRDTRDNNYYTVTKLDDGRCWMTSNLALSAPTGGRVLTPEDSNVESNYTLPAENINNFNTDNTTQAVYLAKDANNTPTGYYSWCAATAGTCSGLLNTGDHTSSSICPKGWRLPGGRLDKTYGNEFYTLFNSMNLGITLNTNGSTNWTSTQLNMAQGSPYNFAYNGQVSGGIFYNPLNSSDPYGVWWSGTASSGPDAYYSIVANSKVSPGAYVSNRYLGRAVRCIAEDYQSWTLPDGSKLDSGVNYMQDITTGTSTNSFCKSTLPNHASITLKDKRDNNSYTIVKMADGKCWMTQNLRLTKEGMAANGVSAITADNSNGTPANGWSMPATLTDSNLSGHFSNNTASDVYYANPAPAEGQVAAGPTGYYSWCAATAGTCSSVTSDGANASSSICPKGWKLPTGGTSGNTDFYNLFKNIGLTISDSLNAVSSTSWNSSDLTKVQGLPYNFAGTGLVYRGSFNDPFSSQDGRWWSSTAYSNSNAYGLRIGKPTLYPGTADYNDRCLGFAIRCIAQ